jgi:hypothetical protein
MNKARKPGRRKPAIRSPRELALPTARLVEDIRTLIEAAREQTARAANSALVGLYWQIGTRIRQDVLREQRAEYGEQIVSALSAQLTAEYGRGFGRRNLFRMIQFAERFPDDRIVSALSAQLGWSHFVEILSFDDPLKRDFYAFEPQESEMKWTGK